MRDDAELFGLLGRLRDLGAAFVTENGCAADDEVAEDGHIYDYDRVMYLRNGMMRQQRATTEGTPLKGSFYRSAIRTPKLSASWFCREQ